MRGIKAKQLRKQSNYQPAKLSEDYDFNTVTTQIMVQKFVPELGQMVDIPYPVTTEVAMLKLDSSRADYKKAKKEYKGGFRATIESMLADLKQLTTQY